MEKFVIGLIIVGSILVIGVLINWYFKLRPVQQKRNLAKIKSSLTASEILVLQRITRSKVPKPIPFELIMDELRGYRNPKVQTESALKTLKEKRLVVIKNKTYQATNLGMKIGELTRRV